MRIICILLRMEAHRQPIQGVFRYCHKQRTVYHRTLPYSLQL